MSKGITAGAVLPGFTLPDETRTMQQRSRYLSQASREEP